MEYIKKYLLTRIPILISSLLIVFTFVITVKPVYPDEFNDVVDWLIGMQDETTGLVESYQGPQDEYGNDLFDGKTGWLYDQALSVIVFTEAGEIERAKDILERLSILQRYDGSWCDGYWIDIPRIAEYRKYVGANSWVILAIVHYTLKTRDESYLNEAQRCADWILEQQIINAADPNYGAIRGGIEADGSGASWLSTEYNCSAYRALKNLGILLEDNNYINQADYIRDWVVNNVWDNQRFICGYNDYTEVLDAQTCAFLAFEEEEDLDLQTKLRQGINWAKDNLIETFSYNGISVIGFKYGRFCFWSGNTWPQHIWWEGTAQMVKVFQILEDQDNYDEYLNQLFLVQDSGSVPYSICPYCNQDNPEWPHNLPYNSVSVSAWLYFASSNINPFIPNFPPNLVITAVRAYIYCKPRWIRNWWGWSFRWEIYKKVILTIANNGNRDLSADEDFYVGYNYYQTWQGGGYRARQYVNHNGIPAGDSITVNIEMAWELPRLQRFKVDLEHQIDETNEDDNEYYGLI